jgi:hypothetical protein
MAIEELTWERGVARPGFNSQVVEGMLLSSNLLCIERLPKLAVGNNSLRNADIETLMANGRSHKGTDLLAA